MDAPRTLAEQLRALKAYRNRPEHFEPLQSNWTTVPANDNAEPEEVADFRFERNLLITPSVQEIMRQVRMGPVVRNEEGKIVSIGKLKFSDGENREKAYRKDAAGKVVEYERKMPIGAMLRTDERLQGQAGGRGYTDAERDMSNAFFVDALGTGHPRYIKGRKRDRKPEDRNYTAAESRELIAKAIANTPSMPPVRKFPTALPCGGERVSDSFVGMQKGKNGESGSIAWEDIAWNIENVKLWREVRKALREKDRKALDAAMTARSLADLGESGHRRTRERQGRKALIAANDNLEAAIKKFVA